MTTPCQEWPGAKTNQGYGITWFQNRWFLAHRAAWIKAHGPIPEGMKVCHTCDNPPCTRVDHLFLGTTSDNALDAVRKGRWARQDGVHNGVAKFNEDQVRAMRACYPSMTYQQIADRFGCSLSVAWNIVKGNTYREVMPNHAQASSRV